MQHNQRDIVRALVVVGHSCEAFAGVFGCGGLHEFFADLRFAEHFVEAVGAEEQAVAGLDAETCAVDSERVTLSNAAGEHVRILRWHEVAGTLALAFDQLMRHRVVDGQFFERTAS